MSKEVKEMSDDEVRARVLRLGFGGDERRFEKFCETLRAGLPQGTGVALRGSVVTAERWEDGSPFDADGKGTSDLDVTLVGDEVRTYWDDEAYYIPKLHTKPLSDKDTQIAPALNPLREELQQIVGRPVAFQATSNLILYARDVLFGQPYHTIIEASEEKATEKSDAAQMENEQVENEQAVATDVLDATGAAREGA